MSDSQDLDFEDSQQFDKIGIGGGVVDDKAGVDGNLDPVQPNGDRVRMPAKPIGLLVNRHVVARLQEPGRRQPGYARADDGYPQAVG